MSNVHHHETNPLLRLKLNKDQNTPGEYRLYELGEIVVTSDSWIWFSAKS